MHGDLVGSIVVSGGRRDGDVSRCVSVDLQVCQDVRARCVGRRAVDVEHVSFVQAVQTNRRLVGKTERLESAAFVPHLRGVVGPDGGCGIHLAPQ